MGHYVKVLTVHLYIRGVKYFLTVLYGQLASFLLKKTEVFLKLTVLLSLRNNHVMTTVITFSESASRIKVILYWTHFFWNVSSYFKLSAWKRSCTISFNYKCHKFHRPHFGKLSEVLPRIVEIAIFQLPISFVLAVVFFKYFLLIYDYTI